MTGGVSGFAGSYIGLTYQTNNFLGLGETLTLGANIGTLQRNISFGFTEPYLFDRPISTGFTIFASRYNFDQAQQYSLAVGYQVQLNPNTVQNYIQNSSGFTVFASYPGEEAGLHALGPDVRIHGHQHHRTQHGVHRAVQRPAIPAAGGAVLAERHSREQDHSDA